MDSLKKRYFIKLAKSTIDALFNVLLLLFVPRVLGPASFGSFNFIRDSFQRIIALSDLNLGNAHVNYAARKEKSGIATNVYYSYTIIIGLLLFLFVAVTIMSGFDQLLFPSQGTEHLILGALLAYIMYLFTALRGFSDSKGATYGFELRSIVVSIVLFITLIVLFLTDLLSLTTFFMHRVLLYILLLGTSAIYLKKEINFKPKLVRFQQPRVKVIIREFLSFSNPLVSLSVISLVFGFFDRWFLQMIYGSVSQGYFGLAFSLSAIAGLFLSPMTPLMMQSVARSDEINDIVGVKDAFDKVKFLYLLGAFLSIFFIFHTEAIIGMIGGNEYSGARLTVMVMLLYPIHVVYGQFCGGALIALRKTRLYRNSALVSIVMGILVSYFLLAPKSYIIPGLELNSLGLALKMVLMQLFSVNLLLYFVAKHVKVKYSRYLLSQLVIPIPIVLLGVSEWLVREYVGFHSVGQLEILFDLSISIIIWCILMGGILWRYPVLVGFEKIALHEMARRIFTVLRNKMQ
jgi:O-antigen/teichoic acid export membrane protein